MKRITVKNPEVIKANILEYFQSSEELKYAYKLHGMLLLLETENFNCVEVAGKHGVSSHTLNRWVHELNKTKNGDIEVLRNKQKPGRNTRISKKNMTVILDILKKKPAAFGLKSVNWNGNMLSTLLKRDFNIELKLRQCQRILQKLGYAHKSGRPWENRGAV